VQGATGEGEDRYPLRVYSHGNNAAGASKMQLPRRAELRGSAWLTSCFLELQQGVLKWLQGALEFARCVANVCLCLSVLLLICDCICNLTMV
jgi:hypothetical protein